MKAVTVLVPLMAAIALAAPSGENGLDHEKRQAFVPPPDDCSDKDAFEECTWRHTYVCLIPNGFALSVCRGYCAGCCGSEYNDGYCA